MNTPEQHDGWFCVPDSVRDALIYAAKRCGDFPEVPQRLEGLANNYSKHGKDELENLVSALETLRISSMADPPT
jgi:hypothetical protein